jgi:hypothetical protein
MMTAKQEAFDRKIARADREHYLKLAQLSLQRARHWVVNPKGLPEDVRSLYIVSNIVSALQYRDRARSCGVAS